MIMLVTGFAALIAGAYGSSYLFAQGAGGGQPAAQTGTKIAVGDGDAMEKDLLNKFPNVNRKMQAMDLGSSVPLYIHNSVDLSPVIVQTLNKWIEPKVIPAGK